MEFLKPLSKNELLKLFDNLEDNRDKIILHNLRLVNWVAKKYHIPGKNELEDLFQVGVLGLMKSLEGYDSKKGSFSNYAVWYIRQSILRHIYNCEESIRIPVYMRERLNKFIKTKTKMEKLLGREPTTKELSISLKIDIQQIEKMILLLKDTLSLDVNIGDEGEFTLKDVLESEEPSPDELIINKSFRNNFTRAFKSILTQLELDIILYTYGSCYTVSEIARVKNLSEKAIIRMKDKALGKIRAELVKRAKEAQKKEEAIRQEVDKRTIFIKAQNYSNINAIGGDIYNSPVERTVLSRYDLTEYIKREFDKI